MSGYVPIDLALDTLRIRILRAIRHFDWCEPMDIADVLNIPSSRDDHRMRNAFDTQIGRMARSGLLDRRPSDRKSISLYLYRISDAGRLRLTEAVPERIAV